MTYSLRYAVPLVLSLLVGTNVFAEDLNTDVVVNVEGSASIFEVPDLFTFSVFIEIYGDEDDDVLAQYRNELQQVMSLIVRYGGDRQRQNHYLMSAGQGMWWSDERSKRYSVMGWVSAEIPVASENGKLLDEIQRGPHVEAGAVEYDCSNRKDILAKARKLALKDALIRAAEIALASGLEVGEILRIGKEPEFLKPEAEDGYEAMSVNIGAPRDVPLMPGLLEFKQEIEVEVSLQPLD